MIRHGDIVELDLGGDSVQGMVWEGRWGISVYVLHNNPSYSGGQPEEEGNHWAEVGYQYSWCLGGSLGGVNDLLANNNHGCDWYGIKFIKSCDKTSYEGSKIKFNFIRKRHMTI